MKLFKAMPLCAAVLVATAILPGTLFAPASFAQTQPSAASAKATLPEATIKALQEALNKQGIAVKADGILNDETRSAIRKYQTQHHLPVTGEPDKATLDKLGVAARQSGAPAGQTTQDPATATGAAPQMMGRQMMQGGMMMPGGMMNCPMMGGQAQGQMQPGQTQSSPMQQGNMMANAHMMQGMMQMMQGMMQIMQAQMQPGQAPAAQ